MCTGGINLENYKNYLNEPNVSSEGLIETFLMKIELKKLQILLNTL